MRISFGGIPGDAIVASRHHGGPDQAIYAYSADDYDWWARNYDGRYFAGVFGENLTIREMPSDMYIGDRLLIGEVVLEASAPRIPCATLAARMRDSEFGLKFRLAERPGVYFRVLNEGEICAGDQVTYLDSNEHGVTVLELFRYKYRLQHEAAELRRCLEAPLAVRLRADIESKLATIEKK